MNFDGDGRWRRRKMKIFCAAFLVIALAVSLVFSVIPGTEKEAKAGPVAQYSVVVIDSADELPILALRYHTTVEEILAGNQHALPLAQGSVLTIRENTVKVSSSSASRGGGRTLFYWPAVGAVTSCYGERQDGFHHGIDIATDYQTEVKASSDGKVVKAEWVKIYGLTVLVDHGNGIETLYAHNSKLLVKKGDVIKAGEALAVSGSTGNTTGPHIHFEVRVNGKAVDPSRYLPAVQIVAEKVF